jgi:hypothetical protein
MTPAGKKTGGGPTALRHRTQEAQVGKSRFHLGIVDDGIDLSV